MEFANPAQRVEVYDRVLSASFPIPELVDRDEFLDDNASLDVLVHHIGKEIAAAVVGEYSAETGLMVIEYLAVVAEHRGGGLGSFLLTSALDTWRHTRQPGAFLLEIERPDAHTSSAAHGDPVRRLEFYRRHAVKALNLPYYQPALRPGVAPVPDLLLGIVVDNPDWVREDAFLEGQRIAAVIDERNPQPGPAESRAWRQLRDACTAQIALCDLADYASIARSGPVS